MAKCLGFLFTSEERMEREIDRWIGAVSGVMRLVYLTIMVKVESKGKALDLPLRLHSHSHL